ncbi:prolyl aminopeptidase [Stappia sp. ES.058]|uniref:prolyl aminopeptidase n=1 Tax=Stappia sp. ES.058 TaxID=1881061 RepID=UPI00087CA609|nr:prolyl aminopeptidase [Stappia sp. ES.058]SDT94245.1 prolyl aminopeptidase Serine peptidase. MEROPS family S33 [Stappia sp. ES.058]
MREPLFPPLEPYASGLLPVSDLHSIHYEECGNPDGVPVVMLHGGPGGGAGEIMRRFHDPEIYRIVLFDQRGCGRSTPHAELRENTTWDLVGDIEGLRSHLGIERWQVFGGSWGSTLSLAYAQTHPERVTSLVLRGIFLLRRAELLWFYQEGASWLYPDLFASYRDLIPEDEQNDLIAAYHRRLTGTDEAAQLEAARRWARWEGSTLSVLRNPQREEAFSDPHYALAFARIEAHYFANGGFFTHDDQLLRDIGKIRDIPGVIVHGRHDVVTPMKNAIDLAGAWPQADLRIVEDAGHAASEPGIVSELVAATRRFAAHR